MSTRRYLDPLRRTIAASSSVLLAIWLGACGGDGPTPPPSVATIEVSAGALTLRVGDVRTLSASAFDARGNHLTSAPIAWESADPAVATVSSGGLVTAVAPGRTTLSARSGGAAASVAVEVELVRIARIVFVRGDGDLLTGGTTTFQVTALDAAGTEVAGWPRQWSTGDSTVARVETDGRLQALRVGETTLRVRVDTAVAERTIRVRGSLDLAVSGLTFAQVVQNDSGGVPMVRGGLPVAVNVFVTADASIVPGAWVRVSCAADGGSVAWSDSARVDVSLDPVARPDAPAVQLLIPNARFAGALHCVAEADPARQVPDTSRANNRYPRTGDQLVSSVAVPPLEVTFVPITLAADGGATGNVTTANVEQYLITVRQLHPVAGIATRIGQALVTSTAFGSGGDAAWRAILRELEARRVLEGRPGHYYGVVRPGTSITFVTYGGFGYITGWTAMGIQVGWFNRESSARELVAHELGHNFGLLHAPCGAAASPDPGYPYAGAEIGARGWDVYSTQQAGSGRVAAITAEVRDLMGYCKPVWISDYNYLRVISGRALLAGGAGPSGAALLVRGESGVGGLVIDPVLPVVGPATPQAPGDGVELEVVDAAGGVLARHRAALLVPDHGGPASFIAVVPVPDSAAVAGVRVRDMAGRAQWRPLEGTPGPVSLQVSTEGSVTRLRWDARRAPHVVVRDESTGEILAFAGGGVVDLPAGRSRLEVGFSNGARRSAPR